MKLQLKQKRSLFLVLAIIVLVVAFWSSALLISARQKTLDQRVQDVASQLKCPICQGESVADSPSWLAQQMRGVIRQQLQEGRSEQQVIQYFENSYGPQIVWSPPWQGFTALAWLVPIVLLLGGTALLFFVLRGWSRSAPSSPSVPLADEHEKELADVDAAELERYRAQLEAELAADDPLFARYRTEAH